MSLSFQELYWMSSSYVWRNASLYFVAASWLSFVSTSSYPSNCVLKESSKESKWAGRTPFSGNNFWARDKTIRRRSASRRFLFAAKVFLQNTKRAIRLKEDPKIMWDGNLQKLTVIWNLRDFFQSILDFLLLFRILLHQFAQLEITVNKLATWCGKAWTLNRIRLIKTHRFISRRCELRGSLFQNE